MSRAFVKESDADDIVLRVWPELPPGVPNWSTPAGAAAFRTSVATQRAHVDALGPEGDPARREAEAELLRLERRAATHVEQPAPSAPARVRFGVTVALEGDAGPREVVLVGVDEVDAGRGHVSWQGPLARALWDAEVGDVVTVDTPRGPVDWEITAIR